MEGRREGKEGREEGVGEVEGEAWVCYFLIHPSHRVDGRFVSDDP